MFYKNLNFTNSQFKLAIFKSKPSNPFVVLQEGAVKALLGKGEKV